MGGLAPAARRTEAASRLFCAQAIISAVMPRSLRLSTTCHACGATHTKPAQGPPRPPAKKRGQTTKDLCRKGHQRARQTHSTVEGPEVAKGHEAAMICPADVLHLKHGWLHRDTKTAIYVRRKSKLSHMSGGLYSKREVFLTLLRPRRPRETTSMRPTGHHQKGSAIRAPKRDKSQSGMALEGAWQRTQKARVAVSAAKVGKQGGMSSGGRRTKPRGTTMSEVKQARRRNMMADGDQQPSPPRSPATGCGPWRG